LSAGADGRNWFVREKALLDQWKYLKELGLNTSEKADLGRRGSCWWGALASRRLCAAERCCCRTAQSWPPPACVNSTQCPCRWGPLECGRRRPVSAAWGRSATVHGCSRRGPSGTACWARPVLAVGSLTSYFRVWWNRSIWEKDSPEQWKYRRESGTQRGGGGRLAKTRILIVRRTRPSLAVRRGTQMVPDCAVM